jgi:hypothetical protein
MLELLLPGRIWIKLKARRFSVNIETAFGQISFKQLSQLDRHANENPLPDYSALLAFASPVKQTKLVRHIFDFLDINLITDLCGKAAAVHTYL